MKNLIKKLLRQKIVVEVPKFYICNTCTKKDINWRNLTKQFVNPRIVSGPGYDVCFDHNHDLDELDLTGAKRIAQEKIIDDGLERIAFEMGEISL